MSKSESNEMYCGDCGCVADDEICPRCRAEDADVQSRWTHRGDRRWNGQVMSRRRSVVHAVDLEDGRGR